MSELMIPENMIEEVRRYEKSATFDYDILRKKYADPYSNYPESCTVSTDVVIAGGGPAGLMYGLFLAQRGFATVVIEPRELGSTSREWNISLEEMMQLQCILSPEEIHGTFSGRLVNPGYFTFLDYFTYSSRNVLDYFVHPEKLLTLLSGKICECLGTRPEQTFLRTGYDTFKIKDDRVCVLTTDNRSIEGKLFLHAMGSQDEINWFENYQKKKSCYNIVGARAKLGEINLPWGDVLRTIDNASFGADKQQILWELFRTEEPRSDIATIYCFYMSEKRGCIPELFDYFRENLYTYINAQAHIEKVLYGYMDLPDDITGLTRSSFPRVYAIGDISVTSVATGCGFGLCVKNLEHIGKKLVKHLRKDNGTATGALSSRELNNVLPDMRQLCSVSIEQLFKDVLVRGDHETVDKPNQDCAALFKLFSLISDEEARHDMLKSRMRPHLLFDALNKVVQESEYSLGDFVKIMIANNGNMFERLGFIVNSYRILLICELKEIVKHIGLFLLFRPGQLSKGRRHLATVRKSNPIGFIFLYRKLRKKIGEYTDN